MPKRVPPLSQLQIRNARPREKPYKLADGGGLYLEVTPAGGKHWRMKYRRPDGRENKLSLGAFPVVPLTDARAKRSSAKELLARGRDPARAWAEQARQASLAARNTFEHVARDWHQIMINRWQPRTAREILRRFEADVFPAFGQIPIAEVRACDVIDAMRTVERRGALEIAKRLAANCSRVFRYAVRCGLADRNPAEYLREVLSPRENAHFAAISADELPDFLRAMHGNEARMHVPTRVALRLMLLVFVRTAELVEATWSEIDLEKGEWIIPWKRMKRGRRRINPDRTDHHVCLSRQARALLHELHQHTGDGTYLFPNQRDPQRPMSNNTLLKVLERMGYKDGMTGHGFRALAMSTLKEALGYRHEVVDRQLAHGRQDRLEGAYDRAQYLDERCVMMQHWADYIDQVTMRAMVVVEAAPAPDSFLVNVHVSPPASPRETALAMRPDNLPPARPEEEPGYPQTPSSGDRIVRIPEVSAMTGLSRSSIYLLIKEGKFPAQVRLSTRSAGWFWSEVNSWVRSRQRRS